MLTKKFTDFEWDKMTDDPYTLWEFSDSEGECLGEVGMQQDTNLWHWAAIVPDRFKANGQLVAGLAKSDVGAKRIVETVLKETVFSRAV